MPTLDSQVFQSRTQKNRETSYISRTFVLHRIIRYHPIYINLYSSHILNNAEYRKLGIYPNNHVFALPWPQISVVPLVPAPALYYCTHCTTMISSWHIQLDLVKNTTSYLIYIEWPLTYLVQYISWEYLLWFLLIIWIITPILASRKKHLFFSTVRHQSRAMALGDISSDVSSLKKNSVLMKDIWVRWISNRPRISC